MLYLSLKEILMKKNIDKYKPDYSNLLIPPAIVGDGYWKKRIFPYYR